MKLHRDVRDSSASSTSHRPEQAATRRGLWCIPKRSGLRVVTRRGHRLLRGAALRYATWLRAHYEFPMRVPIYLLPGKTVRTMHGERCSASFFAPWSPKDEPHIRIATGDYPELLRELGRDNALAAVLCSISHEIVHYQQWVATGEIWEKGVDRKAARMVERYAREVAHP